MAEFKKIEIGLTKVSDSHLHDCYIVPDFPLYAMNKMGRLYYILTASEVPVHFKSDGTAFYSHIRDIGNRERNITIARLKMTMFNPVEDMDLLDIERLGGHPSDDRLEMLAWKYSYVYNNRKNRKVHVTNADLGLDKMFENVEEAAVMTEKPIENVRFHLRVHSMSMDGYEYQYASIPKTMEDLENEDLERSINREHESSPILVKDAGGKSVRTMSIEDLTKALDITDTVLFTYFERSPNNQPVIPMGRFGRTDFPAYIQLKFQDDPRPWIAPQDPEVAACETCRCDAIHVTLPSGPTVSCFQRQDVAKLVGASNSAISNLKLQEGVPCMFNKYKIRLYYKRQPTEESAQRSSEKSRPEKGPKRRHLTR